MHLSSARRSEDPLANLESQGEGGNSTSAYKDGTGYIKLPPTIQNFFFILHTQLNLNLRYQLSNSNYNQINNHFINTYFFISMKFLNTILAVLMIASPIVAKDPKPSCNACDPEGASHCNNGEISMITECKMDGGGKLCWTNGRMCEGRGGCT